MKRGTESIVSDWDIIFTNNIYMYCHDLSVSRGCVQFNIQCEDLPAKKKTIGIWLYELDASLKDKEELQNVLLEWAKKNQIRCQIWMNREESVVND